MLHTSVTGEINARLLEKMRTHYYFNPCLIQKLELNMDKLMNSVHENNQFLFFNIIKKLV